MRYKEITKKIKISSTDRVRFELDSGVLIDVYEGVDYLVIRKVDEGTTGESALMVMPHVSNEIAVK